MQSPRKWQVAPRGVRIHRLVARVALLAFALGSLLAPTALGAATITWTGGATNNNFSSGTNWGGSAPTSGTGTLLAFAGSTRLTPHNDQAGFTYGSITFNSGASAFTVGGSPFTLSGVTAAITNSSANTQTINNTITLGQAQTWKAESGELAFGGAVATGGYGLTLDSTQTNKIAFSNTISGTGSLIVNQTGSIVEAAAALNNTLLSSANTYSGGTTVTRGVLTITNALALGTGPVAINGNGVQVDQSDGSRAQLQLEGVTVTGLTLTLSGIGATNLDNSGIDGDGALRSTGANSGWTGNILLSGSTDVNIRSGGTTLLISGNVTSGANQGLNAGGAGNTTYSGVLALGSGGVTKMGAGTVTLANASNTYTGATSINAGTLSTGNIVVGGGASGLGNASSAVLLGNATSSGTLSYTGLSDTYTRGFTVGAGGGRFDNTTPGQTVTVATGGVAAGGTFTVGGAGNTTINSAISGVGGVTKADGGALTLAGTNTYAGGTTLNAGTLNINSTTALGATASTFTINAGTTIDNTSGGAITLANNNAQNWNGDFTFTGTNNLNLGTGAVTMNASRQVTTTAGNLIVNGAISGSGFSLTKAGAGALTLGGANTYTGGTVLSAGTLNINNASALGTGAFTLAGGTTIDNTSGGAIALSTNNAQNWNGNFTFTGTNDLNLGTGAVTMSGNREVTVNGGVLTVGGIISGGAVGLTKSGAGTLTLTGANTFSGGTTLNAGTLRATTSTGALGNGALTLAGGTLQLADDTGLNFGRNTSVTNNATITSDRRTGTGTGTTQTLGTLSIGNQKTLGITAGTNATSGNAGITFGATTLTGGTTFDVVNNGLGSTTVLTLGALNDGGYARTLTKTGNGTLTLGTNATSLVNGTAINVSAGTLNSNTANALGSLANVTVQGTGATLGIGATQTVGALNGTGSGTVSLGANTLTVGSTTNNLDSNFTGTITGSGGGLTKAGNGTLTVAGSNTYTGTTTISGGTFKLGSAGNATSTPLGAAGAGANTTVSSGGALDLNGFSLANTGTFEGLTISGTGVRSTGALTNTGATATWNGTVALGAATSIGGTGNITVAGVISGANALTKVGTNTLTLQAANTNSSTVTITGGNIVLSGAGTLGGASGYTLNPGGTLTLDNTGTNNTDRLKNNSGLTANGGTFNFTHNGAASTNYSESLGTGNLTIGSGGLNITLSPAATGQTSTVTVGNITRAATSGGSVIFSGTGLGNTTNKFAVTTAPTLANGILGYAVVYDDSKVGAARYNLATYASGSITSQTTYTTTASGTWTNLLNVRPATTANATLGAAASVNALVLDNGINMGLNSTTDRIVTFTNSALLQTGGASTITNNGTGEITLAFGNTNQGIITTIGDLTLQTGTTSNVSGITGNKGVVKAGPGTFTNFATNGNTGGLTINDGTWRAVTRAGAVNSGGGVTANKGTLEVASNTSTTFTNTNITVNGDFTLKPDRATSGSGSGITQTIGTLLLNNSATLTVATGGNVTTAPITLATGAVTLGGTGTYSTINTSGTLTALTLASITGSGNNLTITGDGATTVSGAINIVAGTLTKNGTGTLTLNGTSPFTGGTTVNGGTLTLGHATNTLADTAPITINGGTLALGTNTDTVGAVTLQAGNITGTGAGMLTSNTSFNLQSGTVSAKLGGTGPLAKNGSGTVTLSGDNSALTGGVTLNGGILNFSALNNLGSGTNALIFNEGSLQWNTGNTADISTGRTVTLAGGATLDTGANNVAFTSAIGNSGAGALTKLGSGALTLSGANTYTGGTIFTAGTLNINNASALGTGTFTIAGGTTIDNTSGSAKTLSTNNAQSWNNDFTFTGGSDLNLGTGAVTMNASRQITTNASNLTVGGAISGSGFSLTKAGNGALTLGGANTYTGGTNLNAGTLNINNASALGTGAFTIAAGTTIDNTSGGAIALSTSNAQNWNGNFTFTGTNNLNLGTGAVTMDANRQITANASILTVGGVISGSGFSLTKAGNGALTLGGANTYTGGTNLNAGTLNINNASALGTGAFTIAGGTTIDASAGAITLSTNNAQNWNGNFTFTGTNNLNLGTGAVTLGANRQVTTTGGTLTVGGAISGSGLSLTKAGAGELALGGTNTYTGGTTLSDGTLTVKSGASLASTGALTVNAGTLNLNNTAQTVSSLTGSGGTIALGTSHNLTVNNSGSDSFSGVFTGGASTTLTKSGTAGSTLTLSGNSAGFTGSVNVTAGTLNVQGSNNALGTGIAGTTVGSGATLQLQGGVTVNNGALSLVGAGVGGSGALVNVSGNNTWNNSLALTGNTTISSSTSSNTLTLGATRPFFVVSGHNQPTENGNLTIGGSTLTFSGAGDIVVNNRIRNFAGQTASTSYSDANTVVYRPETTNPGNVTVNMTGSGTVSFAANANSYTGTTTVQAGTLILRTKTNSAAPHDTVTDSFRSINGPLVIGTGSETTTATVQLGNGGAANEMMAIGTTVTMYKDGILNINNQAQTIDTLTFTGGTVTLGTGTLYLNNDVTVNALAGSTASINGSGGYLSMTLNRAGGVDTGPDATRTFTTVGGVGNTYDLTIGGVIQSGNLVKAGAGTMMLNNNNEYTGTTSITGGILNIQAGTNPSFRSALGAGDGSAGQGTTVSSGATLQMQGGIAVTSELLTLNGNGFVSGSAIGNLHSLSGNNSWGTAGATYINLAENSRINSSSSGADKLTIVGNIGSPSNKGLTIGGTGNTTISGNVTTGTGSSTYLTKDGSGTLALSGTNSYQGPTNVTAGVVVLQNNSALGAVSSGVNGTFVSEGAELHLSNAVNGNRTIGGEDLTLSGAGVSGLQGALRNIAGNNSFAGTITLGSPASSTTTIKSDADTLTLSGGINSNSKNLVINGAGNTTLSAPINLDALSSGTRGTLTKDGGGTLTFDAAGALTGTVGKVHIAEGTFAVGGTGISKVMNTEELTATSLGTLMVATGGTVNAVFNEGITVFNGNISGSSVGTLALTSSGSNSSGIRFSETIDASGLTLKVGGSTIGSLVETTYFTLQFPSTGGKDITVGTLHITGDTILDFNNSAGTFLTSSSLLIEAGVRILVKNWISVADDRASSSVWYAMSTVNYGSLGASDIVGGTPLNQITFVGAQYNGMTTTWVSGNNSNGQGWFDREIRPTPEPGTYGAILLSGCLGLIGWRRFRSRSKAATVTKA